MLNWQTMWWYCLVMMCGDVVCDVMCDVVWCCCVVMLCHDVVCGGMIDFKLFGGFVN